MIRTICTKDDNITITAPVLIPYENDCDYCRGEKPLTTEKIKNIAKSFKEYAIIDRNHTYFFNGKSVGTPLQSWITDKPMTLKGVDGEVREYPIGTWMLKTLITDPISKKEATSGLLTGYSASVVPRKEAETFKQAIDGSFKSRVNISDIEDPVCYTVSLVKDPCQYSAKFCNISKEEEEMSEEISQEKLEKGIIGAFKSLFQSEEEDTSIDTSKFALKSDLEEMKSSIISEITTALKAKEDEEDEEEKEEPQTEEEETSEETSEDEASEETSEDEASEGLTEEEEKEFQRLLAKRKKPKASNKSGNGLDIHDAPETTSLKSENECIMEALGRTPDGRKAKNTQNKQ